MMVCNCQQLLFVMPGLQILQIRVQYFGTYKVTAKANSVLGHNHVSYNTPTTMTHTVGSMIIRVSPPGCEF